MAYVCNDPKGFPTKAPIKLGDPDGAISRSILLIPYVHLVEPRETHDEVRYHSGPWDWHRICYVDLELQILHELFLSTLQIEADEDSSNTLPVMYALMHTRNCNSFACHIATPCTSLVFCRPRSLLQISISP